jgi:serine/threonine protein kinase
MDTPENHKKPNDQPEPRRREISNPGLFADDIVFSDTEKILFEEDLQQRNAPDHDHLNDGNPEDRYTPSKKLNQGGMKAIWEVDDHRTARKVAMALIQDARIASEEDIDAFLYEARLTANLQHPNIIPIYDIAVDESGNPYFTMKALRGETLSQIVKKLREGSTEYLEKYTRTRLVGIFLKVCNAIDYAHSKGVIHLDLKPSNVIVGDFGDVHVLDWGLSTLITHLNEYDGEPVSWHSVDDVSLEDGQTLTRYLERTAKRRERRNIVGGTPGYMSPEQAQGVLSDIDFQTDVYQLGSMLYELLTLQCPIVGDTVKEVLHKTVRGEIDPPAKRAPEQKPPPALAAITMKALAADPAERYPTVAALIHDIHQYQDGFATMAENPTFFTHLSLLVKRHKLPVAILAVSAVVVAAVLFNSFLKIKQSEQVAVEALDLATWRLEELQVKNDYIAATAKKVAPDYLKLAASEERNCDFSAAEEALDTALAFDPSLGVGWNQKGRMLLAQRRFSEAWTILSGSHGHPIIATMPTVRLAEKYKDANRIPDRELPTLVRDFIRHNLTSGLPRLFYHLNRAPFDPQTRFPALAEALKALNPQVGDLAFSWKPMDSGWHIDVSENPGLDNFAPLCGLDIVQLTANHTGTPDLKMLTGKKIKQVALSGTELNHLPALDHLAGIESLDISDTRIRNIGNIDKYPRLISLDISGIDGLTISPQLLWCRQLQWLTVSENFRDDPTIQQLAARGTIIIYTSK